jgi:hypothetical protein
MFQYLTRNTQAALGLPSKFSGFYESIGNSILKGISNGASELGSAIMGAVGNYLPDGWSDTLSQLPGVIGEALNVVQAILRPEIKFAHNGTEHAKGLQFFGFSALPAVVVSTYNNSIYRFSYRGSTNESVASQIINTSVTGNPGYDTITMLPSPASQITMNQVDVAQLMEASLSSTNQVIAHAVELDYGSSPQPLGYTIGLRPNQALSTTLTGKIRIYGAVDLPIFCNTTGTPVAAGWCSIKVNAFKTIQQSVLVGVDYSPIGTNPSETRWNIPRLTKVELLSAAASLTTTSGENAAVTPNNSGLLQDYTAASLILASKNKRTKVSNTLENAMKLAKRLLRSVTNEFNSIVSSIKFVENTNEWVAQTFSDDVASSLDDTLIMESFLLETEEE